MLTTILILYLDALLLQLGMLLVHHRFMNPHSIPSHPILPACPSTIHHLPTYTPGPVPWTIYPSLSCLRWPISNPPAPLIRYSIPHHIFNHCPHPHLRLNTSIFGGVTASHKLLSTIIVGTQYTKSRHENQHSMGYTRPTSATRQPCPSELGVGEYFNWTVDPGNPAAHSVDE